MRWDYESYQAAIKRERAERWNAIGVAAVEHHKYGCVVVPHCSNLAAVFNAAEYWDCDWVEIIGAKVRCAEPEDGPTVTMPERYRVE